MAANDLLCGIQAFDEMEQRGDRITHLTERRLRRYLLWDLQAARAMTIKEPADADEMLSSALAVELAPLAGWLHPTRHEVQSKLHVGTTTSEGGVFQLISRVLLFVEGDAMNLSRKTIGRTS